VVSDPKRPRREVKRVPDPKPPEGAEGSDGPTDDRGHWERGSDDWTGFGSPHLEHPVPRTQPEPPTRRKS
jgi:hypothetical protein